MVGLEPGFSNLFYTDCRSSVNPEEIAGRSFLPSFIYENQLLRETAVRRTSSAESTCESQPLGIFLV